MPKVKFEFDLPEDQTEFHMAVNGGKYLVALHEITSRFRSRSKYIELQATTWTEVYEFLLGILQEEGIDPFTEGEG